MATPSLTLAEKLKRIFYLNHIHSVFYVGNPDFYQLDMSPLRRSTIQEVIQSDLKEFFAELEAANNDKNIPRREIIFFVLGKLLNQGELSVEKKQQIAAKTAEIIETDYDFFTFIKYYTQCRTKSKVPSSVQKIIKKYYNDKTAAQLATCVAKANGFNKWSHKDLIKLGHYKSENSLKNAVVNYILTRQINDKASEAELKVLEIVTRADELRRTKQSVDAVPILTTYKLSINQVSSSLHQNEAVWSAAIQNMSLQEILPYLLKFNKHGFLKPGSTITNCLLDMLTSPEIVKTSGIHPMEVFIFMKKFEKGGKPVDQKLVNYLQNEKKLSDPALKKATARPQVKCPHIINALTRCFELACENVVPTNKRYLVTIDVSLEAKKAHCIGSKYLSLLEAAVGYTIFLLRVENDVRVATSKDDQLDLLSVGKKVTFSDLLKKVNSQSSNMTHLYNPVNWAATEKKYIDVFVNFVHNSWIFPKSSKNQKEKSDKSQCEAMVNYRTKINLPCSKFLTFAPAERSLSIADDALTNTLYILGFDVVACRVAECFSRGTFC